MASECTRECSMDMPDGTICRKPGVTPAIGGHAGAICSEHYMAMLVAKVAERKAALKYQNRTCEECGQEYWGPGWRCGPCWQNSDGDYTGGRGEDPRAEEMLRW